MQPTIKRFGRLVGASPPLKRVFTLIRKAAQVDVPVLIVGETGTGKDLVANEIHSRSRRAEGPFVALNTGALSQDMIASELFGHLKGSFTGATENKQGRFAEADGGTLFLDEIGTMEDRTQVALLRVLETGMYRPVGAKRDKSTDVRTIAATNEELEYAVDEGRFREDLFHRFQVVRITMPPLRELTDDIPMLANYFLQLFNDEFDFALEGLSGEALDALCRYSWPGNVRELKNVVAQAGVLAEAGVVGIGHLPKRIARLAHEHDNGPDQLKLEEGVHRASNAHGRRGNGSDLGTRDGVFIPLGATLEEVQKAYILRTLAECANNKTKAAKVLGVSRKTLYDRLNRWGVKP